MAMLRLGRWPVVKVLARLACLDPQYHIKKLGVVHTCNPSTGEMERRARGLLASPCSHSTSSSFTERSWLQKYGGRGLERPW